MWNVRIEGTNSEKWVYNINPVTHEREFVGRFKYANPGRSAKHFVKFLTQHFTPAEYFTAVQADKKSPVDVLKTKGFVSYNAMRAGA